MTTLQRMTWDQAEILGMVSASSFAALDINPANVRWWASQGLIRAAGIGPRGNKLYLVADVVTVATRQRKTPGARRTEPHGCNSSGNSQH